MLFFPEKLIESWKINLLNYKYLIKLVIKIIKKYKMKEN